MLGKSSGRKTDPSECAVFDDLPFGKGKRTLENVPCSRFYTTSVRSPMEPAMSISLMASQLFQWRASPMWRGHGRIRLQ
jgi:hypothetical protein